LHIGIPLQRWSDSGWGRTSEIISRPFRFIPLSVVNQIEMMHVEAEQPMLLENGDIILRRLEYFTELMTLRLFPNKSTLWNANVISETSCGPLVCLYFELKETGDNQLRGIGITFGRLRDETRLAGKLSVWVSRDSAAKDAMFVDYKGVIGVTDSFFVKNWSERGLIAGANESKYYHVMEPSEDSWVLDVEPLPKISIKVERQLVDLGREEGVVDVVDLIMTKRDMT